MLKRRRVRRRRTNARWWKPWTWNHYWDDYNDELVEQILQEADVVLEEENRTIDEELANTCEGQAERILEGPEFELQTYGDTQEILTQEGLEVVKSKPVYDEVPAADNLPSIDDGGCYDGGDGGCDGGDD